LLWNYRSLLPNNFLAIPYSFCVTINKGLSLWLWFGSWGKFIFSVCGLYFVLVFYTTILHNARNSCSMANTLCTIIEFFGLVWFGLAKNQKLSNLKFLNLEVSYNFLEIVLFANNFMISHILVTSLYLQYKNIFYCFNKYILDLGNEIIWWNLININFILPCCHLNAHLQIIIEIILLSNY
jgi:hypothetical protein